MRLLPLAAILASLALAAPAYADAGTATVGAPQVITDPASQVNSPPAAAPQAVDAQPQAPVAQPTTTTPVDTAESTPPPLHVTSQLIGERHSSSTSAASPTTASSGTSTSNAAPAADPAPAAHPAASSASAKQLPFTGIAAWQIAAIGLALLAAGAGLWRIGETPDQQH